jgi:hypothetical protein
LVITISPLHNNIQSGIASRRHGGIVVFIRKFYIHMDLTSPLYSQGHTYVDRDPQRHRSLQGHIYIYINICYFPPSGTKSYKSTTTNPYTLLFTKFVSYQSLGEVFLVRDFIARTSSHQGQDHLDDNGISLLKVPRPHWLRESDDIGH